MGHLIRSTRLPARGRSPDHVEEDREEITRKTSAPKSQRNLRPQHELSDEELSRASGGTVAWSAPWSLKIATESPLVVNTTVKLDDASLWLLKK